MHKVILFASMLAGSANAEWQEQQVCDYETIEIQVEKRDCHYSGTIHANVDDIIRAVPASVLQTMVAPAVCPLQTLTHKIKKVRTQEGRWEYVQFHGAIPLLSQSVYFVTEQRTQVVEGSCRTEWVWVCPAGGPPTGPDDC